MYNIPPTKHTGRNMHDAAIILKGWDRAIETIACI